MQCHEAIVGHESEVCLYALRFLKRRYAFKQSVVSRIVMVMVYGDVSQSRRPHATAIHTTHRQIELCERWQVVEALQLTIARAASQTRQRGERGEQKRVRIISDRQVFKQRKMREGETQMLRREGESDF